MGDRGKVFANIVYTITVVEKRPGLEDVARQLGMSYAVLHSRLIVRTSFCLDEVRDIVRAIPNQRLVSYLPDGTAALVLREMD